MLRNQEFFFNDWRLSMKYIRALFLLCFAGLHFTGYGQVSESIFIGQNNENGQLQTAFILNIIGDCQEKDFIISEDGEVYLKVDKIIALPKEALYSGIFANSLMQNNNGSIALSDSYNEGPTIQCKNQKCNYKYNPKFYLGRRCPRCGEVN